MSHRLVLHILYSDFHLQKIDACCDPANRVEERQSFWNKDFNPIKCDNIYEFDTYMGHEIAVQIKKARDEGQKLAIILPVGPMGMYKWAVYFLKEWNVKCDHVYTFNMDEWADGEGNTLAADDPAAFQNAMRQALFNPLGELTVPENQRNFATKENLPTYPEKIAKLKAEGAKLVLVYGIGRMYHIAFWEPMFAADFDTDGYLFKTSYALCDVIRHKMNLGVCTRNIYLSGNKKGLDELIARYDLVLEKVDAFYQALRTTWYKERRGYGFEVQAARLGGLKQRLDDCKQRLIDYRDGLIDHIEELEEPVLAIHEPTENFKDNRYIQTAGANML